MVGGSINITKLQLYKLSSGPDYRKWAAFVVNSTLLQALPVTFGYAVHKEIDVKTVAEKMQ